LTQEAPPLGGTVSYTFTGSEPGTYTYYSGTNMDLQVEMGLLGAIVVRPTGYNPASPQAYGHIDSAYDREVLFLLSEMDPYIHQMVDFGQTAQVDTSTFQANYWFINGRTGPDTMLENNLAYLPTQPYNCMPRIHPGETLLIRVIGGGRDLHPLHTHGNNFTQIARDGRMLSSASGNSGAPDQGVSDFTLTVAPGATYDALFSWTGEKLGWDMYGHTPASGVLCTDTVNNKTGIAPPDGFDDATYEYCADHEKPIPVALPGILDMTFGAQYSGSPYLGGGGFLPPGEGGFNKNGGFFFMWHSHNEKEMVNFDIFPGGMMTMMIVEPPSAPIVE
jgi:FtsP/CotA-like multicopper oxidase with cupredoxin domain